MATPSNDKYIDRILNYILAEEYQDAIQQCNIALDVYQTVLHGLSEYTHAISGINASALGMRNSAESAELGLKDEIGQAIIQIVREYSQNIIDVCLAGAGNADQSATDVSNRIEYVQDLKSKVIQLSAQKERQEREECQNDQGRRVSH